MQAKCIASYLLLFGFGGLLISNVRALECYTCDSAEDAECATRPGQQISVEECSKSDDECVTAIAAGTTRRGCLTRLFPNKYCAEPCDRCNTNLCNRHIFPADRLRCYQCVGADCINVKGKESLLLLPCPVYRAEDRCYTNVIGISNVQRGCEHTNLPTTCPNVCLKCNSDGCNNELGVSEQTCLECSHTTASPNPACWRSQQLIAGSKRCAISGVKTCTNKLMYGHTAKCFTYVNEQTAVMQRGCSSTMGFYPTGTLRECLGKNCNDECIAIACNNCTTDDDGRSCRLGNTLRPQKCADNAIACYSCEEGVHLRRGCVDNSFRPVTQEACYQCRNADGCNRQPIRTCYHCSSINDNDENAANCAYSLDKSRLDQRNCSSPDELCVSTVMTKLNLKYTLRGCASHVHECSDNDPLCVRCNGSLCNSEPIPWSAMENIFNGLRYLRSYQLPSKSDKTKIVVVDKRSGQSKCGVNSNVIVLLVICAAVGSMRVAVVVFENSIRNGRLIK